VSYDSNVRPWRQVPRGKFFFEHGKGKLWFGFKKEWRSVGRYPWLKEDWHDVLNRGGLWDQLYEGSLTPAEFFASFAFYLAYFNSQRKRLDHLRKVGHPIPIGVGDIDFDPYWLTPHRIWPRPSDQPQPFVPTHDTARRLKSAVYDELTAEQKALLILLYDYGFKRYSQVQLARLLGVSKQAISKRIDNAEKKLRQIARRYTDAEELIDGALREGFKKSFRSEG